MRVSTDVLTVLSGLSIEGAQAKIVQTLERKLYEATNKVLEAAGGKWNRKAKAHLFTDDPTEVLDQVLLTGQITVAKQEFGFFETPTEIVDMLLERAEITAGMSCLEPSAGRGAIAQRLARISTISYLDCYELLPDNVEYLRKEGFAVNGGYGPVDFLTVTPTPLYDRIVMNPPFAKCADAKHVLHAREFLLDRGPSCPQSRLVSVMSAGVEFRQDKVYADVRALARSIERLPEGAFKSSGTMVNTVIVTI